MSRLRCAGWGFPARDANTTRLQPRHVRRHGMTMSRGLRQRLLRRTLRSTVSAAAVVACLALPARGQFLESEQASAGPTLGDARQHGLERGGEPGTDLGQGGFQRLERFLVHLEPLAQRGGLGLEFLFHEGRAGLQAGVFLELGGAALGQVVALGRERADPLFVLGDLGAELGEFPTEVGGRGRPATVFRRGR